MNPLRKAFSLAPLFLLPLALLIAQTATPKKKSSSAATNRTPAARKTSTKKKSTAAAPRSTWRTRQLQPTEQRYKEIQGALAAKGYLQGEPTGQWNQESVEALRRFQVDQKLEPTGKIDSLSLIALGLGPKRETAKATPPPASPSPAAN
jgi:Putative peptidoglycan binding domain